MFVGGSSLSWGGGEPPYGLQRLDWSGKAPLAIHEMRAKPVGFELTFTHPLVPKTASDKTPYRIKSCTYNYHSGCGDNPLDEGTLTIKSATIGLGNKSVRLIIDKPKS